jgi:hypothetical protein
VKHAKLPTGEILQFPPETHDSVVDAAVMRHLNVAQPTEDPPPDPAMLMVDIGAQRNSTLEVLAQGVESLRAQIAEANGTVAAAVERVAAIGAAERKYITEVMARVADAFDRNARAIEEMARIKRAGLKLVFDEKGDAVGAMPPQDNEDVDPG